MDKTRMQQYMSQMRAMFNKHALYSDESPQYQIPFEPNPGDTVKIRFRTLKNNVDAVYFISGSTRAQMQVGLVRNGFDYYEIEIPVGNEPIRYFFEIQAGRVVCYYNKLGVTRDVFVWYYSRFPYAGLGEGRCHVSDFCGPLLQRRSVQRCADGRVQLHR